jgi:hypothetical protein
LEVYSQKRKTATTKSSTQVNFSLTKARHNPNEYLGYTFRNIKAKVKDKDKGKMQEYIFDLENTWDLNLQMIEQMCPDFLGLNKAEQGKLLKKFARVKELHNKRKALKDDKGVLRGKLLMDQQIHEEFKRRSEENKTYYEEQIEEHSTNLEKKESFIKQFEKKFMEVEIFVRRESKTKTDKYGHFINFEVLKFINYNEELLTRKDNLLAEIKTINNDLKDLLNENVELKKRDEYIDMSLEYDNHKSKYNSLINLYMGKIKFLERKNDHLKNVIKVLTGRMENLKLNNEELGCKIKESAEPRDEENDNDIEFYEAGCKGSASQTADELFKQCIEYVNEEDEGDECEDGELNEGEGRSYVGEDERGNPISCEDRKEDVSVNGGWDISCIREN